jgi:hypothetical protein
VDAERDPLWAARRFRQLLAAAAGIPALEPLFSKSWPAEARAVLPSATMKSDDAVSLWTSILAWSALAAVGEQWDAADDDAASLQLFERLRLREPLAEAFAAAGRSGERSWQAAAMVRASFVQAAFVAAPQPEPARQTPAFAWFRDPDVAWLVGVHDYEGVRYFDQGAFERLLWWLSLRQLLAAAALRTARPTATTAPASAPVAAEAAPTTIEDEDAVEERRAADASGSIAELEARLQAGARAAAAAGYRVETLLDAATVEDAAAR